MKTLLLLLAILSLNASAGQAEDSRAMVYEGWAGARYSIHRITVGYLCGVIEKDDAHIAKVVIQSRMNTEQAWANVSDLKSEDSIQEAYRAGTIAVNNGACSAMTPGDRARLRVFVYNLERMGS